MTIKLPTQATDMLKGRHQAELIAGATNAAFWMHGRNNNTALYLLTQVHNHFRAMADELGYDVTHRLIAAAPDLAAEVERLLALNADLLEALCFAADYLNGNGWEGDPRMAPIEAAIAKARGQS